MKKLLSLVLAVVMVCGMLAAFSACSKKGVKIGVQAGTTGELFLKGDEAMKFEGFENVDVQSYDNAALAVQDLVDGKINYVVIDNDVAMSLASGNNDIKVIEFSLTSEQYGIGVDKNQKDLLNSINAILKAKKDVIEEIYESYKNVNDTNIGDWDGTVVTSAKYDANKKEQQLVVATNAAFAPYEFASGNGFAGIDMEIAKLIADELGMELVIMDMQFEAVVSSVGVNGVDIALSGLTINDDRKKVIDFSDPYQDASQVIIAKKDDKTFDDCESADDVIEVLKGLK